MAGPAAKRISVGYPPVKRSSMLLATSSQTAAKSRSLLFAEDIFGFFRQVADTSPPRAEGNHPNPCLPLRGRPLLMAQGDEDGFARRSASTTTSQQDTWSCFAAGRTTQTPTKLALSKRLGAGSEAPPPQRWVSHVEGCAVARGGSASRFRPPTAPQLMSSDANNRAGSARLTIVLAHPPGAFFNSASRLLRRQLVGQFGSLTFDHLAHLLKNNADVLDLQHVLMEAL